MNISCVPMSKIRYNVILIKFHNKKEDLRVKQYIKVSAQTLHHKFLASVCRVL